MEIIAKKKLSLIAPYLIFALLCLAAAIFETFSVVKDEMLYNIAFVIIFFLGFLFSIVRVIKVAIPPHVIITYDNGMLQFADGLQCAPQELEKIHYRRTSRRNWQYKWGTLTVTVNGQDHKFRYIANVVEVQDRLIELKMSAEKTII